MSSYDLTKLEPAAFEHLVNALALRVLGAGHTSFGPGPDGGRDGLFEGEAPYPSEKTRWSGRWYIQSKFHAPSLSGDAQKWLVRQIKGELKKFEESPARKWPDNWIVATNIDPSGVPQTGAFDTAQRLVEKAQYQLGSRFHIWGGRKILDLLLEHPEISRAYGHFLTPGDVLSELRESIADDRAHLEEVMRWLVVQEFEDQQFAKLEQAGSSSDARPGIHELFIDLPFDCNEFSVKGYAARDLLRTSLCCHRADTELPEKPTWHSWRRHPSRAPVWFLRGGPGQGKSTVGQYFCQVQRAAIIAQDGELVVRDRIRQAAEDVREAARKQGHWTDSPRIPVFIELKQYAHWLAQRSGQEPDGILSYIASLMYRDIEKKVSAGFLKRCLGTRGWIFVFDGLDEVPQDVKRRAAGRIRYFLDEVCLQARADVLTLCTSRPQGYAGEFSELEGPAIDLARLPRQEALKCASTLLRLGRSRSDFREASAVLKSASESSSVRELMRTPLQAHIMAIIVRDGGRPPERRWNLFNTFYEVIRRREATKDLPDRELARLLREDEQLLRAIHNKLGFALHAAAETSRGAQTSMPRSQFERLARQTVSQMADEKIEETVQTLVNATAHRLVLVNTPDDGRHLRFDVRSLQEFFAAECIYDGVPADELAERLRVLRADSHWHEVLHFILSALVESRRTAELSMAVEVLAGLNEGEAEGAERALSRRLARGALASSRLLEEGVLEQDKRVRKKFANCLEPLVSTRDPTLLRRLIGVRHRNSRSWLGDFLLDRVRELKRVEAIGGLACLAFLFPKNHSRWAELEEILEGLDPEDLGCLFQVVGELQRSSRDAVPDPWVVACALDTLLGPNWHQMRTGGLRGAAAILTENEDACEAEVTRRRWSDARRALFQLLLPGVETGEVVTRSLGPVSVDYLKFDWTQGSQEAPQELRSARLARSPGGMLDLVSKIVAFKLNPGAETLKGVLDLVVEYDQEKVAFLPLGLQALYPRVDEERAREILSWLTGRSDQEVRKALASREIGGVKLERPTLGLTFGGSKSSPELQMLLAAHPRLAVKVLLWQRDFEIEEPIAELMVGSVSRSPNLVGENVELWQRLFEIAGREAKVLRVKLVEYLRGRSPTRGTGVFTPRSEVVSSLALRLPEEAPVLPFCVEWLSRLNEFGSLSGIRRDPSDIASELLEGAVPDADALKAARTDKNLPLRERAAAALIATWHPEAKVRIDRSSRGVLKEALASLDEAWFYKALSQCFSAFADEGKPADRQLVGEALARTRGRPYEKWMLEGVVRSWRETSAAPIEAAEVADQWLAN